MQTVSVIDRWVDTGRIPSASVAVFVDGQLWLTHTRGRARISPPRVAAPDQVYDLASVTKALAAAPVTAALLEDGRLTLDMRVADVLPDVDPRITLAQLLTHSSGYPWWRPLYAGVSGQWGTANARQQLLDAARQLLIEAEPGVRHSYSDIGMLVLLQLIEKVASQPFQLLHREKVLGPARISDLRFGGWPNAAATERCPVREILVEGTVHDLNCAAMGGISTHAGLFGTALAVAALADGLRAAVADPDSSPLPGRGMAQLWALRGPGSHRGIWDSRTPGISSTGKHWPDDSIGHLGYTGTCVWTSPSRRTTVALLTNRVHPVDEKDTIKEFRPAVHDAVAADLGWI